MSKYAEASCYEHGEDDMYYAEFAAEWVCQKCVDDDDLNRTYKYG